MGQITVIGLDWNNLDYLIDILRKMKNEKTFSNIEELSLIEELDKKIIYLEDVNVLIDESKDKNLVFIVEGSPYNRETDVKSLIDEVENIEIISNRPISDLIFSRLKYVSNGYIEVDASDLNIFDIDFNKDLLIYKLDKENYKIVLDILMRSYPLESELFFIRDGGLDSEYILRTTLNEIKEDLAVNSRTSILIKTTPLKSTFKDLLNTGRILRSENGCPWDREQTYESLRGDLIEEAYETIDAVNEKNIDNIKEELGDLLFQVVLYSQIGYENRDFNIIDVANNINEKLIYRHPHVFSDLSLDKSSKVLQNWDSIKYSKRNIETFWERLASQKGMPSTIRAYDIIDKVTRIGFDWYEVAEVLEKVKEEYYEVVEALSDREELEIELGDLLFTVCNLCHYLDFQPELLLSKACDKFVGRFKVMEEIAINEEKDIKSIGREELERLWQISKQY